MIKEKDIKVGAKFCWDGERVDASGIGEEFSGYYLHQFGTDERDFSYAFSNKSEYPTTFTIVGLDKIDNIECAINDGEMSIVMGKKDIMRFAHLEDAEPEELHQGSLSVPLKVEFGESTLALHHAEDVATMRQILLQIMNWFKTGHRKLPLTLRDPFNDDVCNELYGTIFEWMKDEKEERNDR